VLAQAGLSSRRQAEEWIRAGRITVNGEPATLGQRVSGRDEIRVDGRIVRRAKAADREGPVGSVYLCHRSPGEDLRTGLIERLPRRSGRRFLAVSPMPSIDGGLELVTTDGALAQRLQRRIRDSVVEFSVRVRGELDEVRQASILAGQLDDGRVLVVQALEGSTEEEEGSTRWYHLAVVGASGKDVRQLFERQGLLVSRVMRTSLLGLRLTRDVGRGHFRALLPDEARQLEPPAPVAVVEQTTAAAKPRRAPAQRGRRARGTGPRPSRPRERSP
jgi:23S rRNA pseudouridine2605 synthase